MTYKKQQTQRAEELLRKQAIFYGDGGGGLYRGKTVHPFILQNAESNLYAPVRKAALEYFEVNGIQWWGGKTVTNHPLSSQVACLNHLFPLRDDPKAVLAIAQTICPDITGVRKIEPDKPRPAYIQFEAVGSKNHLNEGTNTRGSNCTSVDALIVAERSDGGNDPAADRMEIHGGVF